MALSVLLLGIGVTPLDSKTIISIKDYGDIYTASLT